MVSVALSDSDLHAHGRLTLAVPGVTGVLPHEAHIGAGVYVGVDLTAPGAWCSVSMPAVDHMTEPLLRALLGDRQVRWLREFGTGCADADPHALMVDARAAWPWTRVATVDALDRWLQLPLHQSLVDAERGISRLHAANSLRTADSARSLVIADALLLARQASEGVVSCMRKLGSRRRPVSAGLLRAFDWLAEGYRELLDEMGEPDHRLSAVTDAWRVVAGRISSADLAEADGRGTADRRLRRSMPRLSSLIDPRQVRARVFALSVDPLAPEITMDDAQLEGDAAIRVRVPAFRRAVDEEVAPRLLVRLVDQVSADPRAESVLTITPPGSGRRRRYFEGVVPLRGMSAEDVRADVYDLLSDVPPAAADSDEALQQARRATVFLSEFRRLLADTQLAGAGAAPVHHLRELVGRLSHVGDDARPLFAGGLSPADLNRLAELGDKEFAKRALAVHPAVGGPFELVAGQARLLVAELAAGVLES